MGGTGDPRAQPPPRELPRGLPPPQGRETGGATKLREEGADARRPNAFLTALLRALSAWTT